MSFSTPLLAGETGEAVSRLRSSATWAAAAACWIWPALVESTGDVVVDDERSLTALSAAA